MLEPLTNLFQMLNTEIYQPFLTVFSNTPWVGNISVFLNNLLTNLFQMFNDARTPDLTLSIVGAPFLAAIMTLLTLILFSNIIYKMFKLSFGVLENAFLTFSEIPTQQNNSTWRKQWKRKK